ncbi:hypothetical protein BBJ28_00015163 [Nothophytophthora sp. Chile5]|nr:hypothetical protein BBJ28_00015163 [Nothophytophthora sp. Chile5]
MLVHMYALHDNEATRPEWAARVRLTPELLEKLRHEPEQVLLQLNVSGGGNSASSHGKSKKTSLLSVKLAANEGEGEPTVEQYELLSFAEDPRINHLCTFRRENAAGASGGYAIYKTGAIHQKLLVQRLLDATEKGRIKDKHAKSVLASKSRSSKLIDAKPEKPTKRQRVMTRLPSASVTRTSSGSSAWSAAAGHTRKLVLPSALSKEEAKETRERIEKGFAVAGEDAPTATIPEEKAAIPTEHVEQVEGANEVPTVTVSARTAAAACEADFKALFSSDSDDEPREAANPKKRRLTVVKKKAAKEGGAVKAPRKAATKKDTDSPETADAKVLDEVVAGKMPSDTILDASAQPKESTTQTTTDIRAIDGKQQAAPPNLHPDIANGGGTLEAEEASEEKVDKVSPLKPVKPSAAGVEVKRARVRSTLLPDRVPSSLMPDLSFFPPVVVQICKRLSSHRSRSVILDESDYESFLESHERFRQDWELLDKVRVVLVGWLVVSLHAMANIQKILRMIQTSIDRFEQKAAGAVPKWQHLLDKSTIHVYGRWGVALFLLTMYLIRVFYLNAFHIVTYGLGIYLLNLFIGFLSPQVDTESDGPLLPHKQSEEFRPFTRRVPEFQFWYSTFKATVVSLLMTLSSAFDIPVFWPILLIYFLALFALTMKRQIKHMWKHNYVPWDHGKQVYKGRGKNSK